jgi:hypothetical protein
VRCETEHNCDGAHRAACSAHRTGTAIDVNVGYVADVHADDASTMNRMLQTRTQAYRWMVANAGRFGFVNYAYEPWHWEYVRGPLPATAPPVLPPVVQTSAPAAPAATATGLPAAAQSNGSTVTLPNGPVAAPPMTDKPASDTSAGAPKP